jgi:uncharacterized protein YdhG (YjbR/CyaY superfamily)
LKIFNTHIENIICYTTLMPSVSSYIAKFPKDIQARLELMRKTISACAPGAKESMKWSMPAFSYKRILVVYAGFKNHIGFYPTPSPIRAFEKDLKKYKHSKGSVQFPHDKPLPLPLIRKITKFRIKESKEKDVKWMDRS